MRQEDVRPRAIAISCQPFKPIYIVAHDERY